MKQPKIIIAGADETTPALKYLEKNQVDGAILVEPVWDNGNHDWEKIRSNTGGRIKLLFSENNLGNSSLFYEALMLPLTVVEKITRRQIRETFRQLRWEILEGDQKFVETRVAHHELD